MSSKPVSPTRREPGLVFPLQEGENVLRICRRHWIYLWPHIFLLTLVAIVPVVLVWAGLNAIDAFEGLVARAFWVLAAVYLAYWAVRVFLVWYHYNHDLWVITNQRIVDVFKRHPFSLRVSSADLVNVQDMHIERDGVLQTLLDYGAIICQTASEQQQFRLSGIPNPREIQALVDRERDRERMRAR